MEGPLLTTRRQRQWCDPCANLGNLIEFVVTLAQIVAAIVVLTHSKHEEHPQEIFRTLIIIYTCACIATLPVLFWRFFEPNGRFSSRSRSEEGIDRYKRMLEDFSEEGIDGYKRMLEDFSSESSDEEEAIDKYKRMLEYFFVGWAVMLVWHLICTPARDYTNLYLWLCVAFFAISCIRDVYPNILCAVVCILCTMIGSLIQLLENLDAFPK